MSSLQGLQDTTRIFARVLGPYYSMLCIAGFVHQPATQPLLSDIGIWPWATGAPVLVLGLFILAVQPFSRGLAGATVSLMAWLMVVRGFALLAFPGPFMSLVNSVTGVVAHQVAYTFLGAVGAYLIYVGWVPARSRPASTASSSTGTSYQSHD